MNDKLSDKLENRMIEFKREIEEKILELRQERDLLYSGLAACVLAAGKEELFIPDSILIGNARIDVIRDPDKLGYAVKVRRE